MRTVLLQLRAIPYVFSLAPRCCVAYDAVSLVPRVFEYEDWGSGTVALPAIKKKSDIERAYILDTHM
jgi:hypothetical protein